MIWSTLAAIVPPLIFTAGAVLMGYGLVAWAHRMELRSRHDDVVYRKPGDRW
jgi:hypothetical protein